MGHLICQTLPAGRPAQGRHPTVGTDHEAAQEAASFLLTSLPHSCPAVRCPLISPAPPSSFLSLPSLPSPYHLFSRYLFNLAKWPFTIFIHSGQITSQHVAGSSPGPALCKNILGHSANRDGCTACEAPGHCSSAPQSAALGRAET